MKAISITTMAILLGLSSAALAQSSTGSGPAQRSPHEMNSDTPMRSHPSDLRMPAAPAYSHEDTTGSINAGAPSHAPSSNATNSSHTDMNVR